MIFTTQSWTLGLITLMIGPQYIQKEPYLPIMAVLLLIMLFKVERERFISFLPWEVWVNFLSLLKIYSSPKPPTKQKL